LFWLLGARRAQVLLIIALVSIPTVLIPGMDWVLGHIFSPVKEKVFFGLVNWTKGNPYLGPAKVAGRIILWTGALGWVAILCILHVPVALRRAEEEAVRIEREADGYPQSDRERKHARYRRALDLTMDEEASARIREKLRHLQGTAGTGLPAVADAAATLPMQTSARPAAGIRQKRYDLIDVVGRGVTGVVYRAHDSVLERDVAVKEIHSLLINDGELLSRFRHEAKILAQLTHPNIVHVYDLLEEDGHAWIVMEFVGGGELNDLLKDHVVLPLPETARIASALAEALNYAHAREIVHRDFKPQNVLMNENGLPKITDFGLARLARSSQLTQVGTVFGSPSYMSPEQAAGKKTDARSDIYSFGVVLYRMLTGRIPFEGDITSVIAQHINAIPVRPREIVRSIPGDLEELVLRMLEKEPLKRPQDLAAVAAVLNQFGTAR